MCYPAQHFVNRGYGWMCKRCSEDQTARVSDHGTRARFFTEGEAEETEPTLSADALARWRDSTHQILVCPRCGVEEEVKGGGMSDEFTMTEIDNA